MVFSLCYVHWYKYIYVLLSLYVEWYGFSIVLCYMYYRRHLSQWQCALSISALISNSWTLTHAHHVITFPIGPIGGQFVSSSSFWPFYLHYNNFSFSAISPSLSLRFAYICSILEIKPSDHIVIGITKEIKKRIFDCKNRREATGRRRSHNNLFRRKNLCMGDMKSYTHRDRERERHKYYLLLAIVTTMNNQQPPPLQ